MNIVLIDHYDSFSQNLLGWLSYPTEISDNFSVSVVQFDDPNLMEFLSKSETPIVISPGPHSPQSAPQTVEVIKKYAFQRPILGVCFGHQCIANYFKVGLKRRVAPNHGSTVKVRLANSVKLTQFIDPQQKFDVMTYNSLEMEMVPTGFLSVFEDQNNDSWAIANEDEELSPIYGLQFHPESFKTSIYKDLVKGWQRVCLDYQNLRTK